MPTFLLTWNPIDTPLVDFGHKHGNWSVGPRKSIPLGSRVFLLRQRQGNRGIFGAGTTTESKSGYEPVQEGSVVWEDYHWEPARRAKGELARYVDIDFDEWGDPDDPPIPRSALNRGKLARVNGKTQSSGIAIPDDAADELERLWRGGKPKGATIKRIDSDVSAFENILTEAIQIRRSRNPALRDQALAASNWTCEACDVNYGQLLGGDGRRVLQVHHKKQLAATDEKTLTNRADLAVVCANCHALIHANPKKALKVEALRKRLNAARRRRST
jgi:hypothetical protein